MSEVHKNDREPIPELLRFQTLARDIDLEATRLGSKVVPKTYRFTIGVPMANAADAMAELVDESLEHFPSNSVAAQERRRCYSQAVAKAKTVKREANKMIRISERHRKDTGEYLVKPSAFAKLVEDANEFIACVHGLKKNVRVKGVESVEDAIAWHLAQIEALDAIQSGDVAPC